MQETSERLGLMQEARDRLGLMQEARDRLGLIAGGQTQTRVECRRPETDYGLMQESQ